MTRRVLGLERKRNLRRVTYCWVLDWPFSDFNCARGCFVAQSCWGWGNQVFVCVDKSDFEVITLYHVARVLEIWESKDGGSFISESQACIWNNYSAKVRIDCKRGRPFISKHASNDHFLKRFKTQSFWNLNGYFTSFFKRDWKFNL